MHKIIVLALATASLAVSAASAAEVGPTYVTADEIATKWVGIAASPNKRVFAVPRESDETVARNAARFECEQVTGRTCSAIAVPNSWDAVVLNCTRPGLSPVSVVGGSGQGAAMYIAINKASAAGFEPNECKQVVYSRSH